MCAKSQHSSLHGKPGFLPHTLPRFAPPPPSQPSRFPTAQPSWPTLPTSRSKPTYKNPPTQATHPSPMVIIGWSWRNGRAGSSSKALFPPYLQHYYLVMTARRLSLAVACHRPQGKTIRIFLKWCPCPVVQWTKQCRARGEDHDGGVCACQT